MVGAINLPVQYAESWAPRASFGSLGCHYSLSHSVDQFINIHLFLPLWFLNQFSSPLLSTIKKIISYYCSFIFVLKRSELSTNGVPCVEECSEGKAASQNNQAWISQHLSHSTASFHELFALAPNGSRSAQIRTHKCCAYIASRSKYCARLNSIQAFSDINRDVSTCNHHTFLMCARLFALIVCDAQILQKRQCHIWCCAMVCPCRI